MNWKTKIETELAKLEQSKKSGLITDAEIKESKTLIENLTAIANLTEEEITEINNRFSAIEPNGKIEVKYVTVNKKKLSDNAKRNLGRATALVAGAGIVITLVGCSTIKAGETVEAVDNTLTEAPVNPEKTTMDDEYKLIAFKALASAQKTIEAGVPKDAKITEKNKEKMVKMLVEYYLLNQMDKYTDEQWANIFQNSTINADDLMNAKFYWEWVDEQRATVGQSNIDYKYLFDDENDADLLNKAAKLIDKIETTSGSEKEAAIAKFKAFVEKKLGSENQRAQYSERALDTFRAVHFDTFDELTNHAVVDDEMEHAINTTITCSLKESELDVKDATIQSLQSKFEIYEQEKLQTRFEFGWNYVATNADSINKYNDIQYIVEFVAENLDLSKQKILPSYEDTLNAMFLNNAEGRSMYDSGVSDGQGGIIDSRELAKYGVNPSSPTARQDYENAVRANEKAKEDASESVTDKNGNTIVPSDGNAATDESAIYAQDYSTGYYDGNNKLPRKSNGSAGYNAGYDKGLEDRKALDKELGNGRATTFQEKDGKTTTTESKPTTYDYTEPANTNSNSNTTSTTTTITNVDNTVNSNTTSNEVQTNNIPSDTPGTYFVPVNETEEIVSESEITYQDYTYNASADIAALEALKTQIISEASVDLGVDEASKSL